MFKSLEWPRPQLSRRRAAHQLRPLQAVVAAVLATAACGCSSGMQQADSSTAQDGAVDEAVFCDTTCTVGARVERGVDRCGLEAQTCLDGCQWSPWMIVTPAGDCTPGEARTSGATCGAGLTRNELCSDTCTWAATSPCADACGDHPASDEVCIPAGAFVRGYGFTEPDGPTATITLSGFYINRFPTTNAEYQACVDATACAVPLATDGARSLGDPARARYPVQGLSWTQAAAYCQWRGRTLPSEAQWEKAARGPAPRTNDYPWGDTPSSCTDFPTTGCTPPVAFDPALAGDEVDAWPFANSYYGVALMLGGVEEWTADYWDPFYYSAPESTLPDPTGPTSGTERSHRGAPRFYDIASPMRFVLTDRSGDTEDATRPFGGVRCARGGS